LEYVVLSQPHTGMYSLVHAISFFSDLHAWFSDFEHPFKNVKINK